MRHAGFLRRAPKVQDGVVHGDLSGVNAPFPKQVGMLPGVHD